MNLVYGIHDKPKFPKLLIFAFQQVLAILAATIAVPVIVNSGLDPADIQAGYGMSQSAALFGAGVGTLVYQLFTKFRSPVYLGSSFAFLSSMSAAFAGATSAAAGHAGLILGVVFAGLVYVLLAILVKFVGVRWLEKLLPPVVIGPTVAIIGLSLAKNAVGDLFTGKVLVPQVTQIIQDGVIVNETTKVSGCDPLMALLCGVVTLFAVMLFSVYGKKMVKLIPFILGILTGYLFAAILTVIGLLTDCVALQIIDFSVFQNMQVITVPEFTFLKAAEGIPQIDGAYIAKLALAYIPVAFVVFAEHIADHKNLSSVIGEDLLKKPGLHRTLMGDGVGSIAGSLFGGCPNTTYGESVGCVAITRNASVITITTAAVMCIVISFFSPFVTFLSSIPNCVMGGVCFALYGFIAVSGLKMLQNVDLNQRKNLFVASVILIAGVGGLELNFGEIKVTSVACALILGIAANRLLCRGKDDQ